MLFRSGTPPPGERLPLGSVQLANHSCSPNCTTYSYDPGNGLSLEILQTSREIRPGEQITFAYGGNFWKRGGGPCPGSIREFRKVLCRCALPACPKGLARWERVKRGRSLLAREATRGRLQQSPDAAKALRITTAETATTAELRMITADTAAAIEPQMRAAADAATTKLPVMTASAAAKIGRAHV